MLPREFVALQSASYANPGVYTVVPILDKGILDLPFHIQRLHHSFQRSNPELSELLRLDDVDSMVRRSLQSTLEGRAVGAGSITICMGMRDSSPDVDSSLYVKSPAAVDEVTRPTGAEPCEYLVSFAPFERSPVDSKYTQWVEERKSIERLRPASAKETILYRKQSGRVLLTEGLVSTLFVDDGSGGLVTAPDTMALPGSMSKLVKILCAHANVPVKEVAPDLTEHRRWRGAFVTNALRVQRVDGMLLPSDLEGAGSDGSFPGDMHIHRFPSSQGAVSDLLSELVHQFFTQSSALDASVEAIAGYSLWLPPDQLGL
jgi:branched-subunit amino acid aminotransferase/4-amino-4-deoxychorismate lyase